MRVSHIVRQPKGTDMIEYGEYVGGDIRYWRNRARTAERHRDEMLMERNDQARGVALLCFLVFFCSWAVGFLIGWALHVWWLA